MKKKSQKGLCILLVILMAVVNVACSSNEAEPQKESKKPAESALYCEQHGRLSVDGTDLVDAKQKPIQLKGVSIFFLQYANIDSFRTMRDEWGINMVRLPLYTAGYDGYCTVDENRRAELKQQIYDAIDAATELGLYVVVDWHVLHECDPNVYTQEAIDFFEETTKKYAKYDNVLYEICNEPNGGTSWDMVKSYANKVIPVIRENAGDSVIIVGTPTWSQDVDKAAADPISGFENIMYALHFYAETHRDDLRQKMTNAIEQGLPVFVSEFGISDASGNGNINKEEGDKWISLIDKYGLSYSIWSLSNKDESSAILLPSTTALSGWSYDDLTDSGKWFVDMMRGGSAPPEKKSSETSPAKEKTSEKNEKNTFKSGDIKANVHLDNSWEADGKTYRQYSVKLRNTGDSQINNWTCKITFDKDVSLDQSWCGAFSASNRGLTITPESYNASIDAGGSVSDIGFILATDSDVKVSSVSCKHQ